MLLLQLFFSPICLL